MCISNLGRYYSTILLLIGRSPHVQFHFRQRLSCRAVCCKASFPRRRPVAVGLMGKKKKSLALFPLCQSSSHHRQTALPFPRQRAEMNRIYHGEDASRITPCRVGGRLGCSPPRLAQPLPQPLALFDFHQLIIAFVSSTYGAG